VNDEHLIDAFENCRLGNEDFRHADHVRMAFLYLCRFPILEALERFARALQRFAEAKGKPNLYHETITWAFLFLIRERLVLQSSRQDGRQPSWCEFAAENPDLLDRKSNLILRDFYSDEVLASELAKRFFILPNRSFSGDRGGESE
jgi:hypothetical protein